MGPVRCWVTGVFVPLEQLAPLAQRAEELGYEGLTLPDHAVMPARIDSPYPGGRLDWPQDAHWPDVWVTIGALAATTTRLRFLTSVYVLAARHPLVAARAVATAAALSGGRVVFGVGVGWMDEEQRAMGADPRTRGARTDEALPPLRRLWAGELVEHRGPHYDWPALSVHPTPPAPVPVWIGGESEAALRRAATLGDGWITEHPADRVAHWVARLGELRAQAGRAGEPFAVAAAVRRPLRPGEAATLGDGGVGHLMVQPWHWDDGDPALLATKLRGLEGFADAHPELFG
jgi:probable F420-dependent oxidoreductase